MSNRSVSLSRQLYQMTWPMLIGMLAISSSQLVDSAFIGQLGDQLGAQPLAVVGFSIPVYQVVIGIQVGLGIATTTLIAISLGAKQDSYAQQLGSLIIGTGFILISLLCLFLWIAQQAIVLNLGADPSLYHLVRAYWFPWLISCWLGAMLYFGFSIFRAYGETWLPGMVLVLSSVINIVLDPLFIFTLDMGLAGAAWATVCAYSVGCLIIYTNILRRHLIQRPQGLVTIKSGLNHLFSFMSPTILSQLIPALAVIVATAIVAVYGNDAIAAWGLGNRIEFFSIIIVLSLTMAMPPMIGKYMGSHNFTQIDELVRVAVKFVILSQCAISILIAIFSATLSSFLTSDPDITQILTQYLWLVPISYSALGISMIMVSVCSAMGVPKLALAISAVRLFVCYLPLLWCGAEYAGMTGLFVGATAGNFCAGYISWQRYKQQFTLMQARHLQQSYPHCPLALNLEIAS